VNWQIKKSKYWSRKSGAVRVVACEADAWRVIDSRVYVSVVESD